MSLPHHRVILTIWSVMRLWILKAACPLSIIKPVSSPGDSVELPGTYGYVGILFLYMVSAMSEINYQ